MSELAIALLRVVVGGLVAGLHGWHKMIDGWRFFTSGAEWALLGGTVQLGLQRL